MPRIDTVTITVTETYARRSVTQCLWQNTDIGDISPLALAFRDQLDLPISVGSRNFYMHGREICLEGLPEPVTTFIETVNGILLEGVRQLSLLHHEQQEHSGAPGDEALSALYDSILAKILPLLPFSFKFDPFGLEISNAESESDFRQEMNAQYMDAQNERQGEEHLHAALDHMSIDRMTSEAQSHLEEVLHA